MNPAKAIPIIYDRFEDMLIKFKIDKNENKKNWADLCEKNFLKSLDHRSFHFKFFEKKH